MELNIRLSSGQVLRGIIESPGSGIRAMVIMVHGLGEHVRRYQHWSERFQKEGIGFIGVDLPGHGKSDGKRGVIKSYTETSEMIGILMNEYSNTFPGVPVFLYGHSLGAGIVLKYVIEKSPQINGVIATSPWLRLSFAPGKTKILLARVMKTLFPSFVQPSGLIPEHLSHDKVVVEAYKNDPLVHDRISASLFYSAESAGVFISGNASSLKIPALVIHGSDDMLTSVDASRDFASKTDLAKFREWDGGYHELHNEPFRDEVFSFILNWMENYI